MARGRAIVLTVEPKGVFTEGTVASAPILPGVCMEVVPGSALPGGRNTYRPYGGATGVRTNIVIAYNSGLSGDENTSPAPIGGRVFGYTPNPGDEMNVLVKAGVVNLTVGAKLILETVTGQFIIAVGTPESVPFEVQEISATSGAARLVFVRRSSY